MKAISAIEYGIEYPTGHHLKDANRFITNASRVLLENVYRIKGNHIMIWVSGSSGSILGTLLYSKLSEVITNDISIRYVRKPSERRHCSNNHHIDEGYEDSINIVVDDFTSSGETLDRIFTDIKNRSENTQIDFLIISGIYLHLVKKNLDLLKESIIIGNTKNCIQINEYSNSNDYIKAKEIIENAEKKGILF